MHSLAVVNCIVVGGGAAGSFVGIRLGQLLRTSILSGHQYSGVILLESGSALLRKVKVSGGGRCNVTHGIFDPVSFSRAYPRGERQLRGMLRHFGSQDMVQWLSERGVELKREADGRVFPITDSSQTIIDCFVEELSKQRVEVRLKSAVKSITRTEAGFEVVCADGKIVTSRTVFMATGSSKAGHSLCKSLGHSITELAPSLFTFEIKNPLLEGLAGTSFPLVRCRLNVAGRKKPFEMIAPLLITHWGLSGPAVLKLSALAARELYSCNYTADLRVSWVGDYSVEQVCSHLRSERASSPNKKIVNSPTYGLTKRFWAQLLAVLKFADVVWSEVSEKDLARLAEALTSYPLLVSGKGVFKEEFVTCGGVDLREVNPATMESKKVPGLFFGGELLDVDGITGGFNFQHAWTSAYIGGAGIAAYLKNLNPD
jgi:predicted Rossmann fold flavoprotein